MVPVHRFAIALLLVSFPASRLPAQDTLLEIPNTDPQVEFERVGAVGDLDGDGVSDLFVGGEGVLAVLAGSDGSLHLDLESSVPPVGFGGARFGLGLGGDADLDSVPDVVVGVSSSSEVPPRSVVRVFSGADGSLVSEIVADVLPLTGRLGDAIAPAGDVDQDGAPDLALTRSAGGIAPGVAPAVAVFSGADGGLLDLLALDFLDPLVWQTGTLDLAPAGDTDGDGFPEVAAFFVDSPAFFSGTTVALALDPRFPTWDASLVPGDGSVLGPGLGGGFDFDGDGRSELAAARRWLDEPFDADVMEVRRWSDGQVLLRYEGQGSGSGFGSSMARLPDLDGDGLPELAIAEEAGWNALGLRAGRVRLAFTGGRAPECTLAGEAAGELFGESVASPGDVDGDGLADLAIVSRRGSLGGGEHGFVRVVSLAGCPSSEQRFALGSVLFGELTGPDDEDAARFEGVKGLHFKGRLEVTGGDLVARARLVSPSGKIVAKWKARPGQPKTRKVKLAEDGAYRIVVQPLGGTTGSFRLVTKGKKKGEVGVVLDVDGDEPLEDGETFAAKFRATAGSRFALNVEHVSPEGLPWPPAIALEVPSGGTFDLAPLLEVEEDTLELGPFPLPESGRYRVVVDPADVGKKVRLDVFAEVTPDRGNEILPVD